MTLMAPPLMDQNATPDADHFELCGETCVASILTALHKPTTAAEVTAWLRAHYGEPGVASGTDAAQLIAYLAFRGVTSRLMRGMPAAAYVAGAAAAHHYSIVLCNSDSSGNPSEVPHTGHWLAAWAVSSDGANVQCMNPFGGYYAVYWLQGIEDQQYGIEVQATPAPTPDDGGLEFMTIDDVIEAEIQKAAISYLGRALHWGENGEPQEIQAAVAYAKAHSLAAQLVSMWESPEAKAHRGEK